MPQDLNLYRMTLQRKRVHFGCPDCLQRVSARDYERHCFQNHRVNIKTTCVWCRRFTWPLNQKQKNAPHLIRCFKTFDFSGAPVPETRSHDIDPGPSHAPDLPAEPENRSYSPVVLFHDAEGNPLPITDESPDAPGTRPVRVLHGEHKYEQRTLLAPVEFPMSARDHAEVNLLEGAVPSVTFQDPNLTLAASYVTSYLEMRDTHDWLHVMVKEVVSESFVRALEADPQTRTLAFSCWCDGGKQAVARFRRHRHWVVVSPKGRFQSVVWPHVKLAQGAPRPKKFACKIFKRVASALHLVNLLGYVSHRKSRCQFSLKESGPMQLHHFYLYRTLPRMFRLPLVLLWNNGIQELCYQDMFQNVSIPRVVKGGMEMVDGQWRQKIKHFYNYQTGWVVPVSRRLVPADQETSHYLCGMHRQKWYFREVPEPLDEASWLQRHAEKGYCFYDLVGDEWWTPRPKDRNVLNYYVPEVRSNQQWRARVQQLEAQLDQLREDKERLREDKERLYERLTESFAAQLKAKDEEIVRLKMEIERLKKGVSFPTSNRSNYKQKRRRQSFEI